METMKLQSVRFVAGIPKPRRFPWDEAIVKAASLQGDPRILDETELRQLHFPWRFDGQDKWLSVAVYLARRQAAYVLDGRWNYNTPLEPEFCHYLRIRIGSNKESVGNELLDGAMTCDIPISLSLPAVKWKARLDDAALHPVLRLGLLRLLCEAVKESLNGSLVSLLVDFFGKQNPSAEEKLLIARTFYSLLSGSDYPEVLRILMDKLEKEGEPDSAVRAVCISALGRFSGQDPMRARGILFRLLRLLKTEDEMPPVVLRELVRAIGNLGGKVFLPEIPEVFQSEILADRTLDPFVRAEAILALKRAEESGSFPELGALLWDYTAENGERSSLVSAMADEILLERVGRRTTSPAVRDILDRLNPLLEDDPKARLSALNALESHSWGERDALSDAILSLLRSADARWEDFENIRVSALGAFGVFGEKALFIPVVERLLEAVIKEPVFRKIAGGVIIKLGEKVATPEEKKAYDEIVSWHGARNPLGAWYARVVWSAGIIAKAKDRRHFQPFFYAALDGAREMDPLVKRMIMEVLNHVEN